MSRVNREKIKLLGGLGILYWDDAMELYIPNMVGMMKFPIYDAMEHLDYDFPYTGNVIIPSDELHHFQRGRVETTNQKRWENHPLNM